MSGKKVFIIKGDITYNAKTVRSDDEFIGIADMSVDIHLLDCRVRSRMGRHGTISSFIRIIRIIQTFCFFKVLSCLLMRFAYLGLFSVTQASIPEVSNRAIEAFVASMLWQIGSVNSTRLSNINGKSDKKSCLKRVNLEASGTT